MFRGFKKAFKNRVNSVDDVISDWYWRKKYNTLLGELELLKEVMRDDVYKKTIKQIAQPLELARYKRESERLRRLLTAIREERNELIADNKKLTNENKELMKDI